MSSTPVSYQFPAILIAGMPNCGKSVLSYLLTDYLNRQKISHYLLRAVPDGEGNWFMQGPPENVRNLRDKHKSNMGYSAGFVAYMKNIIEKRHLPLLVDVGGLPRDEQFGIIRACSHSVLLYKDEEGRAAWQNILSEQAVPLIAELRSTLHQPGEIEKSFPSLQGSISGLDRENPRPDMTFGALLDRIANLCHFDDLYLEQIHLRQTQYEPVLERLLLNKIDSTRNAAKDWLAEDLPKVATLVSAGEAISLYGRGPVWLATMLGAHAAPAPLTIYDARLGWIPLPDIQAAADDQNTLTLSLTETDTYTLAEFGIPGGLLENTKLHSPNLTGQKGIIISGKLPRWVFAALARWQMPHRDWIAVYIPKTNQAIVIYTKQSDMPLGKLLLL